MKNDHLDVARMTGDLLAAIVPHVPFDGWSEPALQAAIADLDLDPALVRVVLPRGAVDLAVAYHRAGDRAMEEALAKADMTGLKFREKVALAVKLRLAGADPELVRRGASLFALPQHVAMGSKLIWETSDRIWRALGDQSEDYNWYSKRLTLSGVYSSVVLYWIGDESEAHVETWNFLDRRIDDVMQFEKVKGALTKLPFVKEMLGAIRAPGAEPDLPGKETRR